MAHANAHYKADFVAAFNKPMLKCVGPSYGDPCGFCVDLTSSRSSTCTSTTSRTC